MNTAKGKFTLKNAFNEFLISQKKYSKTSLYI
nr:MAG TPA: hypothetical protein [Caudoviricetes sp.]